MANEFRIKSLSAANYYSGDPSKLTGSVTVIHEGTSMEMAIKLSPDDCTRIFAVIAGRVAEMMQETALNVARDLGMDVSNMLEASVNRQQAQIEASRVVEEVEDAEYETPPDQPTVATDDEIPY